MAGFEDNPMLEELVERANTMSTAEASAFIRMHTRQASRGLPQSQGGSPAQPDHPPDFPPDPHPHVPAPKAKARPAALTRTVTIKKEEEEVEHIELVLDEDQDAAADTAATAKRISTGSSGSGSSAQQRAHHHHTPTRSKVVEAIPSCLRNQPIAKKPAAVKKGKKGKKKPYTDDCEEESELDKFMSSLGDENWTTEEALLFAE